MGYEYIHLQLYSYVCIKYTKIVLNTVDCRVTGVGWFFVSWCVSVYSAAGDWDTAGNPTPGWERDLCPSRWRVLHSFHMVTSGQ